MYPKDGKADVVDDRRLSFDVDSEPVVREASARVDRERNAYLESAMFVERMNRERRERDQRIL